MPERGVVRSSPCAATAAHWGETSSLGRVTLILAGGAGRRMGGAKPVRALCGRRLIDFATDQARREGFVTAMGLRSLDQIPVHGECHLVLDRQDIDGPLAALAAGLGWAAQLNVAMLLTMPCDAPFLPHDLGARLAAAMDRAPAMAVVPMSGGRLHPACALWRTDALALLPDYLASGRRSLLGFSEHVGASVEDWGAPARDPFFNVNTPDDLIIAEARMVQPHLE